MSCNDPSCGENSCDCTHAYCDCKPPPIERAAPTEEAERRFLILLKMERLLAMKVPIVILSHEELEILVTMIKED